MSKKYKLRKWYPSLVGLKEGDIVEKPESTTIYSYMHKNGAMIYPREVEQNPEFWEEVKEKDYEILSFISNEKILSIDKNTIVKKVGDKNEFINCACNVRDIENKFLKNNKWNIHSICRKSDNEIFTVGDKIYAWGSKGSIESFTSIYSDSNSNQFIIVETDTAGRPTLTNIRKLTPLFTSDDGCEIFGGEKLYSVLRKSTVGDQILQVYIDETNPPNPQHPKAHRVYFVHKVNAEKWIEDNKPRYSKKDIEEAYKELDKRIFLGCPFGRVNLLTLLSELNK